MLTKIIIPSSVFGYIRSIDNDKWRDNYVEYKLKIASVYLAGSIKAIFYKIV